MLLRRRPDRLGRLGAVVPGKAGVGVLGIVCIAAERGLFPPDADELCVQPAYGLHIRHGLRDEGVVLVHELPLPGGEPVVSPGAAGRPGRPGGGLGLAAGGGHQLLAREQGGLVHRVPEVVLGLVQGLVGLGARGGGGLVGGVAVVFEVTQIRCGAYVVELVREGEAGVVKRLLVRPRGRNGQQLFAQAAEIVEVAVGVHVGVVRVRAPAPVEVEPLREVVPGGQGGLGLGRGLQPVLQRVEHAAAAGERAQEQERRQQQRRQSLVHTRPPWPRPARRVFL